MRSRYQTAWNLPASARAEETAARGGDLPAWILADLRSDHAGEVGAVCIYHGILLFAREPSLRAFAQTHLATEQHHLREIESWLPRESYSRLLPVWRLAGFVTGALPALLGPKAVYATIEAVENFVDQHYGEQVHALAGHQPFAALRKTLLDCQNDEIAHRDQAAALGSGSPGIWLRAWCALVGFGSRAAAAVCRHV